MKDGVDSRGREGLVCAGLAALSLAVFSRALTCGFVNFDDPIYITENAHVQQGLSLDSVRWAFAHSMGHYIPLDTVSHMADCWLFGLNAWGHHATSLALHCANVVLLFVALRSTTGALWRSAFVAALFAVHPLVVEPVVWVSSRKDVLSAFLGLTALILYVSYAAKPTILRYSAVLLLFTASLFAKPMMMTLPLIFLLFDYWPLKRTSVSSDDSLFGVRRHLLWLVAEKIPLLVVSAACGLVALATQNEIGALGPSEFYPLGTRIANAVVSYVLYIRKTAWPSGLAPFYPHPSNSLSWLRVIASVLFLICATGALLAGARRYRFLGLGWLWFGIALFPVSGVLVQLGSHAMADRYMYMPSIGLFIICAWGIPQLIRQWRGRTALLAMLAGATVVALATVSWRQVGYWRDSETLFEHTLRVTQNNAVSHLGYGSALLSRGDAVGAELHFRRAAELAPLYTDAVVNLGAALMLQGRAADAAECFVRVLQITPNDPDVMLDLAAARMRQGDLLKARELAERALQIDPGHAKARGFLEWLSTQR